MLPGELMPAGAVHVPWYVFVFFCIFFLVFFLYFRCTYTVVRICRSLLSACWSLLPAAPTKKIYQRKKEKLPGELMGEVHYSLRLDFGEVREERCSASHTFSKVSAL